MSASMRSATREEALAGRRQLAAGGEPAKELCAKRIFQRGDPARDGRVVEFQPPRRAEDLAGAGDGEEDADVVPVHGGQAHNMRANEAPSLAVLQFLHNGCVPARVAKAGAKRDNGEHTRQTPGSET